MKILQKNTLMRFLTIGLIVNVLILVNGCITREYSKDGEFYFINKTNYDIVYSTGLEKYNLRPQSTIFMNSVQHAVKNVISKDYLPPYLYEYAFKRPFIIKINNRCWEPSNDEEHSPLSINSYTAQKMGERKYKFTYTFTDADYERAVACP